MMHDFAVTENYALFFDLPIVFSMEKGGFRFQRDLGGRIGVMPLTGSNADVRWFEVEACTVFHSINAYEQGDEIILQVCRASSIMEHGMNDIGDQSSPWQWSLNLKTGKATETRRRSHRRFSTDRRPTCGATKSFRIYGRTNGGFIPRVFRRDLQVRHEDRWRRDSLLRRG